MKPILNFQIPEWMMKDVGHLKICGTLVENLKKRFSDNYDIIITPWNLQGEGAVTLTIAPDTDVDEFIKKLVIHNEDNEITQFNAEFPLNTPTRNGRIYPTQCMKKAIDDKYIQESLKNGMLFGSISNYGGYSDIGSSIGCGMNNSAFSVDTLNVLEANDGTANMIAGITLLPTPFGKKLNTAIKKGFKFKLIPRGIGSTEIIDDKLVITDGYKLISVDLAPDTSQSSNQASDSFHIKYMPFDTWLARTYDGDPDFDVDKCLDQYWIDMLGPINETVYQMEYVLHYLKENDIDPNIVTGIKTIDGNLSIKIQTATTYGYSGDNIMPLYIAAAEARKSRISKKQEG